MNATLAWPIVTLVFALFFTAFFRRQIGELIGRVTGLWGVKAELPASQPKPREISKELPSSPLASPSGIQQVDVSPLQAPVFAHVENELTKLALSTELERKYLIRTVVQARFLTHYMRAARFVFGSQLQLMTQANGSGGPVPITHAKDIYKSAARQHRDLYRNFAFETWLRFLTDNNFIEVQQEKVVVTDLGRDFMNYLVNSHDTGYRVG
jgi:hypothetical protein